MDSKQRTSNDVLQANKDHFDRVAHTGGYDENPFVEQVSRQIAKVITEEYIFDEDSTAMLDYACGTGQMSRLLAPHVHEIIGVDISQGMVDYYNQRVHNQGIPSEEMHAVCVELTGTDSDLDGKKFDIIVCSQAYHHFADITAVTKILTSLLKPNGYLFVADLMKYDPSIFKQHNHGPAQHDHGHPHSHGYSHSHTHTHKPALNQQDSQDENHPQAHDHHHSHDHTGHAPFSGPSVVHKGGYTEDDLRPVFESAGLVDWKFIPSAAAAEISDVKRVELFLAIGRRPAV